MNNDDRLRAVQAALDLHAEELEDYTSEPEERVIDILTNLRHLCVVEDLDFTALVAVSKRHFTAER